MKLLTDGHVYLPITAVIVRKLFMTMKLLDKMKYQFVTLLWRIMRLQWK